MKKPFAPEVRTIRVRGEAMYEVDCRQWADQMRALEYPLRRRFTTSEQARAWRDRLIVESRTGRPIDPGPMAVSDLSALYLQSIEATVESRATIYNYRSLQKKFLAFCARHELKDVRHMSSAAIELYRIDLHQEGMSVYGVRAALQSVRALFAWAERMGYSEGNPAAGKIPRKPRTKRRAFTDGERERLLAEAMPDLLPMWELLLLTGLRRLEVVRLRVEDVVTVTPKPFVRVHGKGDKHRIVPLTKVAVAIVERFAAMPKPPHREGYLVPWHYHELYELWAAERERIGLPADLHLHSFRHTFLSWLANRTGTPIREVQAVAGHSSLTTTEEYVHRDEEMLRAGMARLEADLVPSRYQDDTESECS